MSKAYEYEYEYKKSMGALRYTPAQKARIAQKAACPAPEERPRKRHTVSRTAVIAVAAAAVLVVSAAATGALRTAVDILSPIFGGSDAQTEVIDKIGVPVGASATDNGVTISADAIIGDKYNAAIVFTVARDDGRPLLPEGVPVSALLIGGSGADVSVRGGWHGGGYFREGENGAVQYVQTVSAGEGINKTAASADFEDIRYWDDMNEEPKVLVEGRWQFSFDLAYEDSSVTLGGGETFTQNGVTFTVDEVTVSPVAVRAAYTADSAVAWSNAESGQLPKEDREQLELYLEDVEILLTKTDGTVLDLSNSGGSLRPEGDRTVAVKNDIFDEIVPLEEMESISVGGIVYPITAE